jgi:hypothetical protein
MSKAEAAEEAIMAVIFMAKKEGGGRERRERERASEVGCFGVFGVARKDGCE